MTLQFRSTPETRSLATAVAVLAVAYIGVHWRYYLYVFPAEVAQALDPRAMTLLPRTNWGVIVRCLLLYAAYRAYPALKERMQEVRDRRRSRGAGGAESGAAQVARAEDRRRQQQPAGQGTAPAPAAPTEADAPAANITDGPAAGAAAAAAAAVAPHRPAGGEDDVAEARKRAWLEKLQAQQDLAAAEKARAAAAAAAAAATEKAPGKETPSVEASVVPPPAPGAAAAAAADARAAPSSTTTSTSDTTAGAPAAASSEDSATDGGSSGSLVKCDGGSSSGAGGAVRGSGSSRTNGAMPRPVSGSNMVPLREAQEAEERQRQWLQQLSSNPSLSPLQREAMEKERQLKAEQDAAFEASLAEDRRRADERAAAETAAAAAAEAAAVAEAAAAEAVAVERQRLEALRVQLRETLPSEPDRSDESAVLVRVRLPDGCCHTRRFVREAPVQQVRDWLQSLDSFPLWDPSRWSLVNSYPRQVVGGADSPFQTVHDVALEARQVALCVQQDT